MNRREMMQSGAAASALVMLARLGTARAQTVTASAQDRLLATLFDAMMAQMLDRSPETVTTLGLDQGARASAKSKLDDRSMAAWEGDKKQSALWLTKLRAVDVAKLTGLNRWNHASILFSTQVQDDIYRTVATVGTPYVVSQLTGCYQQIPDFLDSQHSIETADDANAYLARLEAFAVALDQETGLVRHDVALGVIPPDFILTKTLIQLKILRDAPAKQANLVQSLVQRTATRGIAGDWRTRATAIYTTSIQPALSRQMTLLESLQPKAVHTAGVARLPGGAGLYRTMLRSYTTSAMDPEEIHRTGLELIAQQSAQIDAILASQGYARGSVGQRLRSLYDDPQYRYPNTDPGKEALIADLNTLVVKMQARLPAWFGTLPKMPLTIRRVPKATEAGAPGGYYQSGSLDGTRPGAYYVNLRDTSEVPRWNLATMTYHEGIPGHHLQGTLALEAGLPEIRKVQFFSGYGEGWALYAEELAVEMGAYADDPLSHVGQLHDSMFRAVRLVVDSGMHAMGWSREKAIAFYIETIGDPETMAITEVERYCTWPGQACSYMLGKLDWLRLREKAKAALGPRFDIRKFHDAGLLSGAMPLIVLDQCIDAYISAASATP